MHHDFALLRRDYIHIDQRRGTYLRKKCELSRLLFELVTGPVQTAFHREHICSKLALEHFHEVWDLYCTCSHETQTIASRKLQLNENSHRCSSAMPDSCSKRYGVMLHGEARSTSCYHRRAGLDHGCKQTLLRIVVGALHGQDECV